MTDKEAKKEAKKKLKSQRRFNRWFNFVRFVYYVFVSPMFHYKKYGHKEKFDDRAYIFASNHLGIVDVVPCVLATTKGVHFICKDGLNKKRIGRWLTKNCRCIPVKRDGTDVGAVMQAIKYLNDGENLAIFPEGTRNKTDEIFLPFKSGTALISIKTKTPIVPIVHVSKAKKFRRNYVYIGEPFEFSEYYGKKLTQEAIAECDEILRQKMLKMYGELKNFLEEKNKK